MTIDHSGLTVYTQFKLIADTFANAIAIAETDQKITFSQLRTNAERCAGNLQKIGITAGDRCIVCLPNSISAAIVTLAIWRLNAIPVLINNQSPDAHLQHAVIQTRSKLFITSDATLNLTLPHTCPVITDHVLRQPANNASTTSSSCDQPLTASDQADQPASVIFTSGSTGLPKGVTQSHRTLLGCSNSIALLLGLKPRDKVLCPVPWSFDYGFGQLLNTLLTGVPQVLPKSHNPFDVCHAIERHRPTVIAGVPSLFANLFLGVSPIKDTCVQSVRLITTTGSALSTKILKHLKDKFQHAEFALNYGLTETYRSTSLPTDLVHSHPGSVGYAVPGVNIKVLRKDGTEADAGETGEIVHQGAGAFMGYWGDEPATQRVLKPQPACNPDIASGQHSVYTGDLGYKDQQGLLYICGRKDRQIKSMGVRVSPDEIEACLNHHSSIIESAIITRQHEVMGELITAVIAVSADMLIDDSEFKRTIRRYCKKRLSSYMMPREFIFVSQLPRTVSGKIDYVQVRQLKTSQEKTKNLVNA